MKPIYGLDLSHQPSTPIECLHGVMHVWIAANIGKPEGKQKRLAPIHKDYCGVQRGSRTNCCVT